MDDTPTVLMALGREIDAYEFLELVGPATNGVDAFAKARRLQPQLVLMDIHMPQISGMEIAPMIRRFLPGVRIILTSGSTPPDVENLCRNNGVDLFISKYELCIELEPAIRRLFDLSECL